MGKHAKFILRAAIVVVLLTAVASGLINVVKYKAYDYNGEETSRFPNFYKLPKNSLDVLFLGTSHVREAFIPQKLYDNYGITSYNLGSSDQPPVLSYYWLKEALKTQHPKVVVFDVSIVLSYRASLPEANVRKALDYMHLGMNKLEAFHALCKKDSQHSEKSYYLPNIRYHNRWKELNEGDFLLDDYISAYDKMGYAGTFVEDNSLDYHPFKYRTNCYRRA